MKGLRWSPTPSVQGPCAPRRARTGRCPEPGKETALGLHRGAPCAQRSQRGAIREAARDRGPACRAPHPKALAKAKPCRELPARPPSSFLCPPRLPAEACPTPSPSARVARGVVGLRLCTNVHPSTWTERHACVRTSHHTVTEPDPGRSPGLHKPGNRTGPGHETPPRAPSSGWQSWTPPRSPRRAGALQVPPPRAQGRARPGRVWGGTELNSHSLSKQVVWAAAARHPLPRPARHGAAGPRPGSWSDPEAPGTARPGASGTWEPPPDLGGGGEAAAWAWTSTRAPWQQLLCTPLPPTPPPRPLSRPGTGRPAGLASPACAEQRWQTAPLPAAALAGRLAPGLSGRRLGR